MKAEVLLIQSEPEILETLSRSLTSKDFFVVNVTARREALALIQRQDFDVVVVDLIMKGVDCIGFMREVKNIMPLTEVIFLTDPEGIEAAARGIRLGAFDYVLKSEAETKLPEKILQAKARKDLQEEKIRQVSEDPRDGYNA
jgi:DNA-binding NtrC family response regulator